MPLSRGIGGVMDVVAARSFLLALIIGTCGGAVFAYMHFPLAWMLGSMLACTAAATMGAPIAAPSFVRPPVISIVGLALGTGFSPDIIQAAAQWLPTIAGLALYLAIGGFLCVFYLRRVAGYDRLTAFYSGMPGGLSDMVIFGEQHGADVRRIALIHSSRIILVVSTLPALIAIFNHVPAISTPAGTAAVSWSVSDFGWAVLAAAGGIAFAHVLRLPAKYLLGPMIASAAIHLLGFSSFTLPVPVVNAAQVVLGVVIGCRFRGTKYSLFLPVVLHSAVVTLILLTMSLSFAAFFDHYLDAGFLPVILAFSPGGLTEMGLVAVSLQIDVAFIIVHHLLRIFLVLTAAQALGRRFDHGGET
jgi:membrane AbrB-like protein